MPNGTGGNNVYQNAYQANWNMDWTTMRNGLRQQLNNDGFGAILSPEEAVPTLADDDDRPKRTPEDDKFVQEIFNRINNGEDVSVEDMSRTNKIIKRTRHVNRDERQFMHKPKKDGAKTMNSVRVDDLVTV
jgi:hypothetical protein